jgi:hypothetical protein
MTDIETIATELWTKLHAAMLADGLITKHVTTSGPATTKVVVDTCMSLLNLPKDKSPWLKMEMHPEPGREVVAKDLKGSLHIIYFDEGAQSWYKGHSRVRADKYSGWTFVAQQGVVG